MLDDARERRKTEPPPDAFAEAACRDEDEPSDPFRALEEKHLRNASAERVTDDVRFLYSDGFQPPSDDACIPIELVADVGTFGLTVPWQVGHQHAPVGREEGRDARPREA